MNLRQATTSMSLAYLFTALFNWIILDHHHAARHLNRRWTLISTLLCTTPMPLAAITLPHLPPWARNIIWHHELSQVLFIFIPAALWAWLLNHPPTQTVTEGSHSVT